MTSTPPSTDKNDGHALFEHWKVHQNITSAIIHVMGPQGRASQGACEHMVKNAISSGRTQYVVGLLDDMERASLPISVHQLNQVCLAWHVHRPKPSTDVSALLLMLLMRFMSKHGKEIKYNNCRGLSRLLSDQKSVDHMIDAVCFVNKAIPHGASFLHSLVLHSALQEREGVCFQKWIRADQEHQLFVPPKPELWDEWSVSQKQQHEEDVIHQRFQQLSTQRQLLSTRYSTRADLANPPPIFDVWWSHLNEYERQSLVPSNLGLLPSHPPLIKLLAPYITCQNLSASFEHMLQKSTHGLMLAKESESLALRALSLVMPYLQMVLQKTPTQEIAQCHQLLVSAMKVSTIKAGQNLWSQASAVMEHKLLEEALKEDLLIAPPKPKMSKL